LLEKVDRDGDEDKMLERERGDDEDDEELEERE
jgi:hypothetical protein